MRTRYDPTHECDDGPAGADDHGPARRAPPPSSVVRASTGEWGIIGVSGYRFLSPLTGNEALTNLMRFFSQTMPKLNWLPVDEVVLTRLGGHLNTEAPRLREGSPRAENHH